jgi:PKD repeat protein
LKRWTEDSGWVDVTISLDTENDTICGETSGLSFYVLMYNPPPEVEAGENITAGEGDAIIFNGNFTDPGDESHNISWDFGDGCNETGTLKPSHAYMDDGIYK